MSPWGLLTWRGRGVLVLGCAIALVALYRGQRDLLWLGLLLMLLPLGALGLIRAATPALRIGRQLVPAQAPVGTDVVATLSIDKERDLGGGLMLFEEQVPRLLGPRPRFTIHQTAGHAHREISYHLSGQQRGRYRVGPLRVETRDALGLVRVLRGHTATSELLVTPRVEPVFSPARLGGVTDQGEATPHRLGIAGEDDILVREYRHGDDMRRVHWRSTARHGELMVRREEQAWDPRVTIVLDNRQIGHAGQGPASSFEWVVSAAASLALHFLERGFRVHLVDAVGDGVSIEDPRERTVAQQRVLEMLTDTGLADTSTFTGLLRTSADLGGPQLVVALLGAVSGVEGQRLAGVRGAHGTAVAVLLDTASFLGTADAGRNRDAQLALAVAGWDVLLANRDSTIASVWHQLGRVAA